MRSAFFSPSEAIQKSTDRKDIYKDESYHRINIDMLYNELFFYTLFTSIYKEYLYRSRQYENNTPKIYNEQGLTNKMAILFQRWRIEAQRSKIITATSESIKQLWNLESSYPLHIWLLMYTEDLYNVRQSLTDIYLPLHQLHYKLENVQKAN
jgi:hypothetical protein